ncbi:hypothetical protein [Nocardia caishijiensis]|uniref:Uncharacterized protein n=1 Tax=Nocardia caishijiensis TaxID=184756 RepID=A0ABQ6YIQ3_9NOCA|nr:hypothetical protein [Nocardia caishijiensis]KAF0845664.1 hypothetical protein FNL39_10650 [Nocardia caishijiensis]
MNPPETVTLPLSGYVVDPYMESDRLQLTVDGLLPPVCIRHGDPAVRPKRAFLRFWGRPGAYRPEGSGRVLWESVKSVLAPPWVTYVSEPFAVVSASWPECVRCGERNNAKYKRMIIYFGIALVPLLVGIAWMTIHASAFAFLTCVISALVIFPLALFAWPAVFAKDERYLEAELAPDGSRLTLRAHPNFVAAWGRR